MNNTNHDAVERALALLKPPTEVPLADDYAVLLEGDEATAILAHIDACRGTRWAKEAADES